MEEFNYPPELIQRLLDNRKKHNEIVRERMRQLRQADPEKYKIRNREYMRQTGKAREYYLQNRDTILARKRELYRLKKLKQKEQEQNSPSDFI
jgi:hypothetical protein